MFETSMVRAQTAVARRRAGFFTVSLIAHTAIVLGIAAVSVASVDFPGAPPDEVANAPIFARVQIPPPLGNPNGGAPPRPEPLQRPVNTPPPPPDVITAPATVPDDVPAADTPSTGGDSTATGPATGDGTVPGPIGVPDGDPNSIAGFDAPPVVNTTPVVEEKIYTVAGEVKAPVATHKVAPEYPRGLVPTRMRATVVVRCIIDKNGRVRDPRIVSGSLPPFNAETIEAVSQWRFTPGSYRGQAVDVYFDLTVTFTVTR